MKIVLSINSIRSSLGRMLPSRVLGRGWGGGGGRSNVDGCGVEYMDAVAKGRRTNEQPCTRKREDPKAPTSMQRREKMKLRQNGKRLPTRNCSGPNTSLSPLPPFADQL